MRFTDITELIRQYQGISRIDKDTKKPVDPYGNHLGGHLIIEGLTVHFKDGREYYVKFLDSEKYKATSKKSQNKKHS
jgi:hypothetical protein